MQTPQGVECRGQRAALLAVRHAAPAGVAPAGHPRQLHAPSALERGRARPAHCSGQVRRGDAMLCSPLSSLLCCSVECRELSSSVIL